MTTFVGSAKGTTTPNSGAITTAVGDIMVVIATRNASATAPSLAGGFTNITTSTANTNSMRAAWKICTSTSEAVGTWTNATETIVHVYRPTAGNGGGIGAFAISSGSSVTVSYTGLTLFDTTGNSWIAAFGQTKTAAVGVATAPSTFVNTNGQNETGTGQLCSFDTNGGVSSSATHTVTITSSVWKAFVVEILDVAPGTAVSQTAQFVSSEANPEGIGIQGKTFLCPIPNPVGSGNCLVLGITYMTSVGAPTITDNINGAWPAVSVTSSGASYTSEMYVFPNAGAGQTTLTIAFASLVWPFQYNLTEYYGVATTTPVNGTATTSTTPVVAPKLATGSFTPGNNNANGGNIVQAYYAPSAGVGSHPISYVSAPTFVLLNGDVSWSGNQGFPHAGQHMLQATSAAINPSILANGEITDLYNCVALALKLSSGAGTAPNAGRIAAIQHQTYEIAASNTWKLQIPTVGNLRVFQMSLDGGSALIDSEGGTVANGAWTKLASGGPPGYYSVNKSPNQNFWLQFTMTSQNQSVRFYDIVGADPNPFAGSATTTGIAAPAPGIVTDQPILTPTSATSGVAIGYMECGIGPGYSTSLANAIWDLCTYPVAETDADLMENADCCAHIYYSGTSALHWGWTINGATFTGTGAGTNLTVTGVTGYITLGIDIAGTGVPGGTTIVSQTSGTPGGAGVYVTSGATTSVGATITTNNSGGVGGAGAFAFKFASSATAPTGWFNPWDQPNYTKPAFSAAPAFVSTFKTAVVSGIGWFEPPDIRQPLRLGKDNPPGFGTTPPQAASTIAGMAWFEPPDKDRPAIKINGESPPAYDARPPQVPISGIGWFNPWEFVTGKVAYTIAPAYDPRPPQVPISGIGWFEPPDIPGNSIKSISLPPAFTMPNAVTVGIMGMGWFEPPDVRTSKIPYPDQSVMAWQPVAQPVPVSGIAWFEPPDRDRPATKVTLESPPAQTLLPPLLISQIQGMAWFTPLDYARPIQAFSQSVAYVSLPPAAVPISGMGWFEPPDRDRIAIKVTLEALPAIQLIPGTLPAPISGMAWFQPWPNIVKLWPGQSEPPAFEQPIVQLPPPLSTLVDVDIPRELWRRHQKRLREVREARERQDRIDERIRQIRRAELRKAFEKASGAVSEALDAIEAAPVLAETPDTSELTRDLAKIIVETRMPQALRKSDEIIDSAAKIRKYYEELREEEDLEIILLGLQ